LLAQAFRCAARV